MFKRFNYSDLCIIFFLENQIKTTQLNHPMICIMTQLPPFEPNSKNHSVNLFISKFISFIKTIKRNHIDITENKQQTNERKKNS